jgi:hypothetical protein
MENEGCCYVFQHSPDGHEPVIADSCIAFQAIRTPSRPSHPGRRDNARLPTPDTWTATAIRSVKLDDHDPTGVT